MKWWPWGNVRAAEARAKAAEHRAFLMRDALEQARWRIAMNLETIDQKAAWRVLHMAIERDDRLKGPRP